MKRSKFNRFRAYLRYKLKGKQKSSKIKPYIYIGIYILISFSVFLIPEDILERSKFAKAFSDFMEFIPAIKEIEHRSALPQIAKFYMAYMFVVGMWFFAVFSYSFFIYAIHNMVLFGIYKNKKISLRKNIKILLLKSIIIVALIYFFFIQFIKGEFIGSSPKYQSTDNASIDDIYGLLFYVDYYELTSFAGLSVIIVIIIGNLYIFLKGDKNE